METNDDDLDDKPLEAMSFAELQETILRGAQAVGAPEALVEAVAQVSSAAPEQEAEAAPARRPRRAAGKPATAKAGLLDNFG